MVFINYIPNIYYSGGGELKKNIFNSVRFSVLSYHSLGMSKTKFDFISYYLAGLIEGDGHFNTPKKLKTPSGTARIAAIEVVFATKDKPSAELLQSLLGGKIYNRPNKNNIR